MNDFRVTPQDIANASASCTSTAGNVETQLASLKSYVVNMEGWWNGVAATTFQELMQEYDIYSSMLHNALVDIGSGLNGNFVNYHDSEQANVTSINKIQNELGLPPVNLD